MAPEVIGNVTSGLGNGRMRLFMQKADLNEYGRTKFRIQMRPESRNRHNWTKAAFIDASTPPKGVDV